VADKTINDLTAVTSLASGDLFEIENAGNNSRKITATNAAKALGTLGFSGAMVKKAADQTGANYSAGAAVAWDAEVYDTDSIHDNVTNNTRLTTPTGATYVQVGCTISAVNVTAGSDMLLQLRKDGSSIFDGMCQLAVDATATASVITICSGPIPVTGGTTYFEAFYINTDTSSDITASRSNFWMRVLAY
jgi:hypothetical protein